MAAYGSESSRWANTHLTSRPNNPIRNPTRRYFWSRSRTPSQSSGGGSLISSRHLVAILSATGSAAAQPEIVFLQGGADVLDGDPLANLRLTPVGLVKRDVLVIDACVRRNVPLVDGVGYYFLAATIARDRAHPLGQFSI